MDEFINSFSQLMLTWGYGGMFISAFIAGSIIPFSSEIILLGLIKIGLAPSLCILFATIGNTLGGMTCYGMGRLGKIEWIEKYMHMKREKIEKMHLFLQGKGAMMAFFSFVPFLGGVMVVTLGLMRSNIVLTALSMILGKLIRYILIYIAFTQAMNLFA